MAQLNVKKVTKAICEFPNCGNTLEKAQKAGKRFQLNRIPISHAVAEKWILCFRVDLSRKLGQSLSICCNHYDANTNRLILPQPKPNTITKPPPLPPKPATPVKKEIIITKKTPVVPAPVPAPAPKPTTPITREPPEKRRAAQTGYERVRQALNIEKTEVEEQDEEPFSGSEKSWAPSDHGGGGGGSSRFSSPEPESEPPALKKIKQEPGTAAAASSQSKESPKNTKKSWWGDDSDDESNDGFQNDDDFNVDANASRTGGEDQRYSSDDDDDDNDGFPMKMQQVVVKLEKIDTSYLKDYKPPVVDDSWEKETLEEAKKSNDMNFLMKVKKQFETKLAILKMQNQMLERKNIAQNNKISFVCKTFGFCLKKD